MPYAKLNIVFTAVSSGHETHFGINYKLSIFIYYKDAIIY